MAEESFTDLWEIKTKEEFEVLRLAFEDAKNRPPREHMDVLGMLEEGRRLLKEGHFRGV